MEIKTIVRTQWQQSVYKDIWTQSERCVTQNSTLLWLDWVICIIEMNNVCAQYTKALQSMVHCTFGFEY